LTSNQATSHAIEFSKLPKENVAFKESEARRVVRAIFFTGDLRDYSHVFRELTVSMRDGESLPRLWSRCVSTLRCGCLAGGLARFQCAASWLNRLIALCCWAAGAVRRCGGRRMGERSVHLVDHAFPDLLGAPPVLAAVAVPQLMIRNTHANTLR
jgi:hypothetical protein